MTDLLVLSLGFFGLFLLSLAISYALAWYLRQRQPNPVPLEGSQLKISSGERLYRTRFLGVTADGWAFQPPLENGVPVPLRIGDPLHVEAACDHGALRFRSSLIWRSADPFLMVMHVPSYTTVSDRRQSPRLRFKGDVHVAIDGAKAALLDIGECGAKLVTDAFLKRGQRIKLDAPWSKDGLLGHVLDVSPAQGFNFAREVRVVFEELAPLGALKKEFAPAI